MKTRLLTSTMAAVLLAGSPAARAAAPEAKSQNEMKAMCQRMDPAACREMMREMVRRKDLHKSMAEELMQSPEFEQTWQDLHKHLSAHGG